jgi:DNA modification methylase
MWYIDPTFDKVHSAVFPVELCNRIVQFYSYVGDLVFDPFGGSGTVAKAALNLRRYFFLTEIQDSYIERIKEQIRGEPLFDERIPEVKSLEDFKKAVR